MYFIQFYCWQYFTQTKLSNVISIHVLCHKTHNLSFSLPFFESSNALFHTGRTTIPRNVNSSRKIYFRRFAGGFRRGPIASCRASNARDKYSRGRHTVAMHRSASIDKARLRAEFHKQRQRTDRLVSYDPRRGRRRGTRSRGGVDATFKIFLHLRAIMCLRGIAIHVHISPVKLRCAIYDPCRYNVDLAIRSRSHRRFVWLAYQKWFHPQQSNLYSQSNTISFNALRKIFRYSLVSLYFTAVIKHNRIQKDIYRKCFKFFLKRHLNLFPSESSSVKTSLKFQTNWRIQFMLSNLTKPGS